MKTGAKLTVMLLIVSIFVVMTTEEARGHAYRNPPPGARALGMDGGKAAFIGDASAVTHNPANLTEREEAEGLVSLTAIYASSEYTAASGASAETDEPWKWMPSAFAVLPLQPGILTAGVGITAPYGQSTRWDRNAPFTAAAPYYARLQVVDVQPVIACRLGPAVSVAVGADIYDSEIELHQALPYAALGLPMPGAGTVRMEGDDNAVGATAAVNWTPGEKHRFALVYHSGFDLEQEGDLDISGLPAPVAAALPARNEFSMEMKMPAVVTLGYGLKLNDALRLGADLEWVEFSRNETMPLDLGMLGYSGLFPREFRQEWKDVWTAGLAAQWDCSENWTLSAGYKFMESPVNNRYFSPTLPDADKHALSLGMGYRRGRHGVSAAYQLSLYEDAEVIGNAQPVIDGDYELDSHIVSLQYSLDF